MTGNEQGFPVSYAQQRLWFLDRLSPGSAHYVIPVTVRLSAAVDVRALRRSLNEIVRRHEMLRTRFELRDGDLHQLVVGSLDLDLPVTDLRGLPPEDREPAVRDLVAAEARRPFDLGTGPLIRSTLFSLAADEHLLFIALHHIAADGWSVGVLLAELRSIYPAFVRGLPNPLPDLPIQYADYASWQRERLRGPLLDTELGYWRDQLRGLPSLELPRSPHRATPHEMSTRKAMTLSPDIGAGLTALARAEGATMFMTLLAGFQALLHRRTGQCDFAVGTVIATRSRAETEQLIGCFVNTLVIRARVEPADSYRGLLGRTREATLSAYAHQELPFERLVEELRPARESGRNPLVQILFSFHNTPPLSERTVTKLRGSWELDRGTANFDVTVDLWNTPAGLESRWEYQPELVDAEQVRRLMADYERLLRAAVEHPDLRIAEFPLTATDEQAALLALGRGRALDLPATRVDRAIAQRVSGWPGRIAASGAGLPLSYADMLAGAGRLTHALRERGIGAGDLVGICLQRSPSVGIAVLGVLGADAAFVPMAAEDPPERLRRLLESSGARLVLTDRPPAHRHDFGAVPVLRLDDLADDRPATPAADDRRPAADDDPDRPAYLIHTSGTTGEPKGVLIPHRALANHGFAVADRYGLVPGDRILQLASLGFDVALEELLPVWLTGGTVHFPESADVLSPAELERCVRGLGITVLNLPASYWHEWVDHLRRTGGAVPDSLRLVVCGSERVSTEKLRQWLQIAGPQVRWLNAYGVSEATITATTYEPELPLPDDLPGIVPIGRPLANVDAYVLDAAQEPVAVGEPGELYLGGAGIAIGYLDQPELTAAQFVSAPFGTPLYRTGDLARFDADGNLEFLGRRDEQVKIRGHRVELGEVEAALLGHPGVREAAVAYLAAPGRADRLLAYVVANDTVSTDHAALTGHLERQLPDHMVPTEFVPLDSLPRTAGGKIDRAALPAIGRPAPPRSLVAPRTPREAQLAALWADVLDLPEVGVTDNFFDLGGHSLLAMRLVSQAAGTLALEIPLRLVFDAPTVAGLAGVLGERGSPADATPPLAGPAPSPDIRELVDGMSEAEVDALLARLLHGGDG